MKKVSTFIFKISRSTNPREDKIIWVGGLLLLPPCSTDLAPSDFHLFQSQEYFVTEHSETKKNLKMVFPNLFENTRFL